MEHNIFYSNVEGKTRDFACGFSTSHIENLGTYLKFLPRCAVHNIIVNYFHSNNTLVEIFPAISSFHFQPLHVAEYPAQSIGKYPGTRLGLIGETRAPDSG